MAHDDLNVDENDEIPVQHMSINHSLYKVILIKTHTKIIYKHETSCFREARYIIFIKRFFRMKFSDSEICPRHVVPIIR